MSYIGGLDISVTSPAMVVSEIDSDYCFKSFDYIAFTDVSKNVLYDNIVKIGKSNKYNNVFNRHRELVKNIIGFIDKYNISHVAIEDYSFASRGRAVFQIAELSGIIINELLNRDICIRKYSPKTLKLYATGYGNSTKVDMDRNFKERGDFNLDKLPDVREKSNSGNPKDDIIDAYFAMKLLNDELSVRGGKLKPEPKSTLHKILFKNAKQRLIDLEFIS